MCGEGGVHGEMMKGHVWRRGGACIVRWGVHSEGEACVAKGGRVVGGGGNGAWQRGAVRGRRDGHCSGWYASYWNAFLLNYQLLDQVVAVTDYAEGELFQILEDDGQLPEEQVLTLVSFDITHRVTKLFLHINSTN